MSLPRRFSCTQLPSVRFFVEVRPMSAENPARPVIYAAESASVRQIFHRRMHAELVSVVQDIAHAVSYSKGLLYGTHSSSSTSHVLCSCPFPISMYSKPVVRTFNKCFMFPHINRKRHINDHSSDDLSFERRLRRSKMHREGPTCIRDGLLQRNVNTRSGRSQFSHICKFIPCFFKNALFNGREYDLILSRAVLYRNFPREGPGRFSVPRQDSSRCYTAYEGFFANAVSLFHRKIGDNGSSEENPFCFPILFWPDFKTVH